jgi:hypothetical protein
MQQQLWGYKVEKKIYLGVRERKRLNIAGLQEMLKYSLIIMAMLDGRK